MKPLSFFLHSVEIPSMGCSMYIWLGGVELKFPHSLFSCGWILLLTSCWLELGPWWRHQMETCSALLAICAGNSPVSGEFPTQSPVKRSFDVFFDLRLDERLSKHSWGWWLETPSYPLWRQSNAEWRRHWINPHRHDSGASKSHNTCWHRRC